MGLVGTGVAIGVVVDRIALELRKPAADQFPWLRARVNDRVNPWLLAHRIPGSEKAEIGTLEHVGRRSGSLHFTPVHPTLRDNTVLVPAPLGDGSQWALNALRAGHARLQLHDVLLDLDEPEVITVTQSGMVPARLAAPFDRMGWRYVRFHVAGRVPGSFAARTPTVTGGGLHEDAPIDRPFELHAAATPLEPAGAG
jgi:hypothetical protein